MIPVLILQMWFLGLVSLGLLAGAVYTAREWQQRSWSWDASIGQSVFTPQWGWNEDTMLFALAVLLSVIIIFGGSLLKRLLRMLRRSAAVEEDETKPMPRGDAHTIDRPHGCRLHVECYGPKDGIPLVLTHGWTLNSTEWKYFVRKLAHQFRIVVWDEPGLGRSTRPSNRDYSLETLAGHLQAVLNLAEGRPAILLGHSIGGMITLTFSRIFPNELKGRVMGLILTHTTPTDPVKTTSGAEFYRAIEKPVLMPMMYLTILFSPLFWILNWLSYRNGSAHLSAMRSSYAGTESWEQIEFAARFQLQASPAVVARGMLGMMQYDASKALPQIKVPSLIVGGDQDTTTKPEASDWMTAQIPGSRRVMLSPARHLGLIEHHEAYAGIVAAFARQCAADARIDPRAEPAAPMLASV